MSLKLDHLEKLLATQLKDAYSAEMQLLDALPKMRDAASDQSLRKAFADHLEQTRGHVSRIEKVCDMLGYSPKNHACKAMKGLIEEGSEVIKDKDAEPAVKDAALICAAQKVEHYEIALYGCLRAYADLLGKQDAAEIIEQTLEEERDADAKLTEIAERWINEAAAV